MRSASCTTAASNFSPWKRLRVFIGQAFLSAMKLECISAAIERAMPRAVSSLGQKRSRWVLSASQSIMARLSQMTVSPSQRIGTLPPEGAKFSVVRTSSHSSPYSGTVSSSKGQARLLARQPSAHRPAAIGLVSNYQFHANSLAHSSWQRKLEFLRDRADGRRAGLQRECRPSFAPRRVRRCAARQCPAFSLKR